MKVITSTMAQGERSLLTHTHLMHLCRSERWRFADASGVTREAGGQCHFHAEKKQTIKITDIIVISLPWRWYTAANIINTTQELTNITYFTQSSQTDFLEKKRKKERKKEATEEEEQKRKDKLHSRQKVPPPPPPASTRVLTTHQIIDLIQQFIHLLAVHEANVGLPEETSYLPLDVFLPYVDHHHEGHHVVQHCGQQPVLLMLKTFPFRLTQAIVPWGMTRGVSGCVFN